MALHGRRRWLAVERERLVVELEARRGAVKGAVDKKCALSWVESYEKRVAKVDEEMAVLGSKPGR